MNVNPPAACDVSIVIPVYNGSSLLEKHLTPFLGWLRLQNYSSEVILVDDGSADCRITEAYAREHHLPFLHLSANRGKGAALRKGFSAARASIQLFTDIDIPFHYHNVASMISLLRQDPRQLIIGDRTDPASIYFQKTTRVRNWGSNMVSLLVNTLLVKKIKDTQCGLKGMGSEVARRLFAQTRIDRFAIDIELIYLAHKNDMPIRRMPVQLRYNDASTVHATRDGSRLLIDICRIIKFHGNKRYE